MKGFMKKRLFFLLDTRGAMYVDLVISIIVIFSVIASFLFIYPLFSAQQAMNTEARTLVSVAEEAGQVNSDINTARSMIEEKTGWAADVVEWDAVWLDESAQTVQLNDPITVIVTTKVPIPLFRAAMDGSYLINIEVKGAASGASQVYYKP
jgi:hypothetical protein